MGNRVITLGLNVLAWVTFFVAGIAWGAVLFR